MVFAKTSKAASRLSESIRVKDFSKTYLAVVTGTFQEKQGRQRKNGEVAETN